MPAGGWETAMRTRRTTNPNQLALWGRYEMEALMTIKCSRLVVVAQAATSLPKITVTVAEPTGLTPVFRCLANPVLIFRAPANRSTDQLPGRLQAVGVRKGRKPARTVETCSRW